MNGIVVNFGMELTRNTVGFFLVLVGLGAMAFGAHIHTDTMIDAGKGLVGAALLAFQSKRAPDGNTMTVQTTVPPPAVAEAVIVPK